MGSPSPLLGSRRQPGAHARQRPHCSPQARLPRRASPGARPGGNHAQLCQRTRARPGRAATGSGVRNDFATADWEARSPAAISRKPRAAGPRAAGKSRSAAGRAARPGAGAAHAQCAFPLRGGAARLPPPAAGSHPRALSGRRDVRPAPRPRGAGLL